MNSLFTIVTIGLAVMAAVYVPYRLALTAPLDRIGALRNQTRTLHTRTLELLDKINDIVVQHQAEAALPDWMAESLPRATEQLDEERSRRDEASAEAWDLAGKEIKRNVLARLLTPFAYEHPWHEYRQAQILLTWATWQLFEIAWLIDLDGRSQELPTITELIREHEKAVIGDTTTGMCESCYQGQYLCMARAEMRYGRLVLELSCRSRKLWSAIQPPAGDRVYRLFKVNE